MLKERLYQILGIGLKLFAMKELKEFMRLLYTKAPVFSDLCLHKFYLRTRQSSRPRRKATTTVKTKLQIQTLGFAQVIKPKAIPKDQKDQTIV